MQAYLLGYRGLNPEETATTSQRFRICFGLPERKSLFLTALDSSLVASFGASKFRSAKAVAVFYVDIETDWARGL